MDLADASNGAESGVEAVRTPDVDGGRHDSPGQEDNGHLPPKYTILNLFNPPPKLETMRRRLYEVKDKIELKVEEWDLYWPYVSNVWSRTQRRTDSLNGYNETDYFACRLHRPTYDPGPTRSGEEGRPKRKKQRREGGTCQMRIKAVLSYGACSSYTITQVGDHKQHTHDLDHMDQVKRNSVVMQIAKSEVIKGYTLSSILALLNEDKAKLTIAGGRYLTRSDVSNASATWRQKHPGEMACHEGYELVKGKGIAKTENWNLASLLGCPGTPKDTQLPANVLYFPVESRSFLEPYLPAELDSRRDPTLPWVTLTYATSMDSGLSLAPGTQTILSGPESKAMTHYLRSSHDAILVGVSTAVADNPGLNCRLEGVGGYGGIGWEGQPRPVIVDPTARWMLTPESRILQTVKEGKGRAPWIVTAPLTYVVPPRTQMLKHFGGTYMNLPDFNAGGRLRWEAILKALAAEGIKSIMIEGGGTVINELLNTEYAAFIDSVIVTVAPTYLGRGGVVVCPEGRVDEGGKPKAAVRFEDVKWQPLGEDVVMCGRIKRPA